MDACQGMRACGGIHQSAGGSGVAMHDGAHRWERKQVSRIASWDSPWVRRGLPAVESAAERTRLWWGAAALMASLGGPAGRTAAVRGLVSMGVAELLSNTVG